MSSSDESVGEASTPLVQRLIQSAFHSGPAERANELIDEVRGRVQQRRGVAVNYEVPLMGRGARHLREQVAPRLALFLRSKRVPREAVFISLFVERTLYFLPADELLEAVRLELGLDRDAFARVVERWAATGCASGGALPGD